MVRYSIRTVGIAKDKKGKPYIYREQEYSSNPAYGEAITVVNKKAKEIDEKKKTKSKFVASLNKKLKRPAVKINLPSKTPEDVLFKHKKYFANEYEKERQNLFFRY